jgi:hypothetical protein
MGKFLGSSHVNFYDIYLIVATKDPLRRSLNTLRLPKEMAMRFWQAAKAISHNRR